MDLKRQTVLATKTDTPTAFEEALSKIVSIPRAEMQKRIESVPEVPVSRHMRYKYVPSKPPQKP